MATGSGARTSAGSTRRVLSLPELGLLGVLAEIAAATGGARTVREVVELSAPLARRALDADALSIGVWERETGLLRMLVNDGQLPAGRQQFPVDELYRVSDYPLLAGLEAGGRGHLDSLDDEGTEPSEAEILRADGMQHAVAVPVRVLDRTWGELYAARRPGRAQFGEMERELAITIAALIAAGLGQVRHLERVSRLAYEDALTGLANRRSVDDHLDKAMELHRTTGTPVSLVVCDVNGLKEVNDEQGHAAGDQLLVSVADALSLTAASAPGVVAGRLGGDEFCLLMVGTDLATAVQAAEELCRRTRRLHGGAGVACGVASTDDSGRYELGTPGQLFRLADAAQYRAKRAASTVPVVAGRTMAGEADGDLEAGSAGVGVGSDRRATRRRRGIDVASALAEGLIELDGVSSAQRHPSGDAMVVECLTAVANAIARRVDASGWWVSRADLTARTLVTVANSVPRYSDQASPWHRPQLEVGAEFALDDYPTTERAIRGGSFSLVVGRPGNDLAEEVLVLASGNIAMVAAGGTVDGAGWLVEFYADELSSSLEGVGPVLRALIAAALVRSTHVPVMS